MAIFRLFRGFAAFVFGIAVVAGSAVTMIVLALLERIIPFVYRAPSRLRRAPAVAGWLFWNIVGRFALGARGECFGAIPQAKDGEVRVLIANHPSMIGAMFFLAFVSKYVSTQMVWIGKSEHLWNPFIGWPLWLIDGAIFIYRAVREQALAAIGLKVPVAAAQGAVIGIFPDSSRPTADAIAKNHARHVARGVDVSRFPHTLVPSSGGLAEILDGVRGQKVVIINITAGFSRPDTRYSHIFGLVGSTYYFHMEVLENFPVSLDERRAALIALWVEKNRRLSAWKKTRSAGEELP